MQDFDLTKTPLVFVDVETTGFTPSSCRMIEVAAIRVENGEVTQKVVSLLRIPEDVPAHITEITGIKSEDLVDAPEFAEVADKLVAILEGAVFVAHNARFDYSFFIGEFARIQRPFTATTVCTCEMARILYPELKKHKLQTLIEAHGYTFNDRHRAEDDALVLQQFLNYSVTKHGNERVLEAVRRVMV